MPEVRSDYYKMPHVEALFMQVLEKKSEVRPEFDLKYGYRFPEVETATGLDPESTVKLMETLNKAKILDRQMFDMEIRCPFCNGSNISTFYICPNCNSANIKKTLLVEHLSCGYIGPLVNTGGPLVCPKCGNKMLESEYRNAGSIYECDDCKKQVETPYVNHWCRACGKRFNFDNSIYMPSYYYYPSEATKKDMSVGILYLAKVAEVFSELGFKKFENVKVTGESGIEHSFDATFDRNGTFVYVDLMSSPEPIGEVEYVREFGKITDSKKTVFLIVMPRLDENAKLVSRTYVTHLVEASTPSAAITGLKTAVTGLVSDVKPAAVLKK